METKLRLKILSKWLQQVTTSDFGYDVYSDGKLEDAEVFIGYYHD